MILHWFVVCVLFLSEIHVLLHLLSLTYLFNRIPLDDCFCLNTSYFRNAPSRATFLEQLHCGNSFGDYLLWEISVLKILVCFPLSLKFPEQPILRTLLSVSFGTAKWRIRWVESYGLWRHIWRVKVFWYHLTIQIISKTKFRRVSR